MNLVEKGQKMILQRIELNTVADLAKLDLSKLSIWEKKVVEYLKTYYKDDEEHFLNDSDLLQITRENDNTDFEVAINWDGLNCNFENAVTAKDWWEAEWDNEEIEKIQLLEEKRRDEETKIREEDKELQKKWQKKEDKKREKLQKIEEQKKQKDLIRYFEKCQKDFAEVEEVEDDEYIYYINTETASIDNASIYLLTSDDKNFYNLFYVKRELDGNIKYIKYSIIKKNDLINLWEKANRNNDLLEARRVFVWKFLSKHMGI